MHWKNSCAAALLVLSAGAAAADDAATCKNDYGAEAIAACTRLIERNPNDDAAYVNRADKGGRDDIDRSIADYGEAIRINPANAEAWLGRGLAWFLKRNHGWAIADLDYAITLNQEDSKAYAARGLVHFQDGDAARAIGDFDRAIGLAPPERLADPSGMLYRYRGHAYSRTGAHSRAIADYDEAIRLDPNGSATDSAGKIHFQQSEYDNAIAEYDRMIALFPNDSGYYNDRGNAHSRKGEHDLAIADFDRASALDPKFARYYHDRGVAYDRKGDDDRAIADFAAAITLNPNYAAAYVDRGLAYNRKRDYDRAIADFGQAATLDPKLAGDAYINRGMAHNAKGDRDRAYADFDEAIRLGDKAAFMAVCLFGGRKPADDVIAACNQALSFDSKAALVYIHRGLAYDRKGEYDRATADYDEAIRLDPKSSWGYNNRGVTYASKGERDLAMADYSQAIALDPKAYVDWLAKTTGKPYRLLSEAEWEYAARGQMRPGLYPRFWFGDDEKELCRYGNFLDQRAGKGEAPCNDGFARTSPTGQYTPNAFGLYDMFGNAWQWTADCWHGGYNGAPSDGSAWTVGCQDNSGRVIRGGAWNDDPWALRAAARYMGSAAGGNLGILVGRTLTP
jgi:tetratricopeptide (TPR) repeat protein